MKQTELRHADVWILLAAWLLLLCFALFEILGVTRSNPLVRALLLLAICLIFYMGGFLLASRTRDRQVMREILLLCFLLYLYLLLSFTLLDPTLGRGEGSIYDREGARRADYIKRFVNLTPFESIYHIYIKGFLNGYVNGYYTLLNLVGNVCAFMPFSFFLPYFWKGMRRAVCFLPTVLLCVVAVELLQFLFMVGSCDIDDLILNAGGAWLAYLLLSLPPIRRAVNRAVKNEQ